MAVRSRRFVTARSSCSPPRPIIRIPSLRRQDAANYAARFLACTGHGETGVLPRAGP